MGDFTKAYGLYFEGPEEFEPCDGFSEEGDYFSEEADDFDPHYDEPLSRQGISRPYVINYDNTTGSSMNAIIFDDAGKYLLKATKTRKKEREQERNKSRGIKLEKRAERTQQRNKESYWKNMLEAAELPEKMRMLFFISIA